MNETEFRQQLKKELEKEFGKDYTFKENENLIYKVIIDDNLIYKPNDPKSPKRGHFAFEI